jgi:hypothetical protein
MFITFIITVFLFFVFIKLMPDNHIPAPLTGDELGFAVSIPDSEIPTNTTITATISDGTNSLTATTIDSTSKGVVIGNASLTSGTLECTFTLNTTDTSVTPTIKDYAICILR